MNDSRSDFDSGANPGEMKIAYFDCFSGISGEMVLGSLFDACADLGKL